MLARCWTDVGWIVIDLGVIKDAFWVHFYISATPAQRSTTSGWTGPPVGKTTTLSLGPPWMAKKTLQKCVGMELGSSFHRIAKNIRLVLAVLSYALHDLFTQSLHLYSRFYSSLSGFTCWCRKCSTKQLLSDVQGLLAYTSMLARWPNHEEYEAVQRTEHTCGGMILFWHCYRVSSHLDVKCSLP